MRHKPHIDLPADGPARAIDSAVLDSLSAHIAILDRRGGILRTNRAWRRFAESAGAFDPSMEGVNYLAVCESATGEEAHHAHAAAEGIRAVLDGKSPEFLYDYPCHGPDGRHWYYMRVIPMQGKGPGAAVVSHEEITALKLAEEKLRLHEAELEEKAQSLEDMNTALNVMLKKREKDREELERQVVANIREIVLPYVEKLKDAPLKKSERTLVSIISDHLQDVVSPMLRRLAAVSERFTPQEIQVAALVRDGRTSREIADALNVTEATVAFHRKNIRGKLGLSGKKANLRAHLLSIS